MGQTDSPLLQTYEGAESTQKRNHNTSQDKKRKVKENHAHSEGGRTSSWDPRLDPP